MALGDIDGKVNAGGTARHSRAITEAFMLMLREDRKEQVGVEILTS